MKDEEKEEEILHDVCRLLSSASCLLCGVKSDNSKGVALLVDIALRHAAAILYDNGRPGHEKDFLFEKKYVETNDNERMSLPECKL